MIDVLWGKRAKLSYLMITSVIILFTLLGAREIWTQEHRWADIVSGMFYRHDFLHPYLGESRYYDKPLLSYWLIAIIGAVWGKVSVWTLRAPSALAGLLAIWSIYKLGSLLKDKALGFLSGWMLLTTYYFLFWARTSSADMLNLGGSLFAVAWYFMRRTKPTFFDFTIFFLILAVTSLCKGLGGAIVPLLVVFVDVIMRKTWRQYLKVSVFLSAIPALIVYVTPFIASSLIGGESYGQSGLYLVYRENILRYFQPFDHQGPLYTYFLYLPIYLLPWTLFFIPALLTLPKRWKSLSLNRKWIAWSLLVLFMFFTLSGSRRSYYVLPLVPFAILLTADWILSLKLQGKRQNWVARLVVLFSILLFLALDILPAIYYARFGVERFANGLMEEASVIKPWKEWKVVMLDAESKLNFYLDVPPTVEHYGLVGNREGQTLSSIVRSWPFILLQNKPAYTVYITRERYVDILRPYFGGYLLFQAESWRDPDTPAAFIPLKRPIRQ